MRCCVPFCKNTEENVPKSGEITFHDFPTERHLRTAWLRALGKQGSRLPDTALICSQHFLNDDIYESKDGLRQIRFGAIPSIVQICRICLDTDSKLSLISKYKLESAYEDLTGYSLCEERNLKQTLCIECAQRLINFSKFRDKSLKAHSVMMDLVKRHELITLRQIKMIGHVQNQLKSNFVKTTIDPNYSDLSILEYTETDKRTDDDVMENDESYHSMLSNGDNVELDLETINEMEIKVENDSADCVEPDLNEESISDDSIMRDIKLLDEACFEALMKSSEEKVLETLESIKEENATFDCGICFETFFDEDIFNGHMTTHFTQPDSDDTVACDTQPASLVSTENASELRALSISPFSEGGNDDAQTPSNPLADSACTSVAPLLTRYVTNNGKLAPVPEGNDEVELRLWKTKQIATNSLNNYTNIEHEKSPASNLYSHTRTNTETKVFICDVCQNVFKKKVILVKHLRVHSENKPLFCKLCKCSKFDSSSSLVRHMRTCASEKSFSCKLCEYKGAQKSYLVRHMRTHTGEKPFICQFCGHKCTTKYNLVKHMRTHTGEKPYSCTFCEYKCAINSQLVKHMMIHTGEKPFSCKLCEYKCARNSNLNTHMKIHTGEKPFSCKLCEYKCARNFNLNTHMKIHTGEKPFSCNLCQYQCGRKGSLVTHMRTHTGEKPFSCKLCEYKCTVRYYLINHMKTHTGEKPFSCSLCEYKCTLNNHLVSHMRTHTGEKPFTCMLCEYKCAQKGSLDNHMKTHSGEKPFSCKLCEYQSARKGSLLRHMRTHSAE